MNELQIFNNPDFGQVRTISMNENNEYLGYVYILECGGVLKIGSTKNPFKRLQQLVHIMQNYADKKIGRFALTKPHTNYYENELILHKRFNEFRIKRTELFNAEFNDVVSFAIDNLSMFDDSEKLKKIDDEKIKKLKEILFEKNTAIDFEKMSLSDMDHCLSLMENYKSTREALILFLNNFIS